MKTREFVSVFTLDEINAKNYFGIFFSLFFADDKICHSILCHGTNNNFICSSYSHFMDINSF